MAHFLAEISEERSRMTYWGGEKLEVNFRVWFLRWMEYPIICIHARWAPRIVIYTWSDMGPSINGLISKWVSLGLFHPRISGVITGTAGWRRASQHQCTTGQPRTRAPGSTKGCPTEGLLTQNLVYRKDRQGLKVQKPRL